MLQPKRSAPPGKEWNFLACSRSCSGSRHWHFHSPKPGGSWEFRDYSYESKPDAFSALESYIASGLIPTDQSGRLVRQIWSSGAPDEGDGSPFYLVELPITPEDGERPFEWN